MNNTGQSSDREAYGEIAALRYNEFESRPTGFAIQIAPKIYSFYLQTTVSKTNQKLIDVACGTGQLVNHFLNRGFTVVGIDNSQYMLRFARNNNKEFVANGKSQFHEWDSSNFYLKSQFGLAVCTFNGLNHLANFNQVNSCIESVFKSLVPGGYFLFDINTKRGLHDVVKTVDIQDSDDDITVRKRKLDGERVILNASGCFLYDGKWVRYRETIFKIFIDTNELQQSMLNTGWSSVVFTTDNFTTRVADPEAENVAYIVACK